MGSNGRSPLTPLAQDALEALASAVPSEGEFSYEQAYAILAAEEDLERTAGEDIIERLYMKGYLYEVKGNLRLTDYWIQFLFTRFHCNDPRLHLIDLFIEILDKRGCLISAHSSLLCWVD